MSVGSNGIIFDDLTRLNLVPAQGVEKKLELRGYHIVENVLR